MKVQAGWLRIASVVSAAAALASCGGGEGAAQAVQEPARQMAAALRGVVVDGYVEGARVFLDLNGNQSRDEGEPQAVSGVDGAFSFELQPLSAGQLASAMLVAEVPESARDSDDGGKTLAQAGRKGFTMMSPASVFIQPEAAGTSAAVISPLTTLVAAEVAFNGMTPSEAEQSVRDELKLSGKDLMTDYVALRDSELHRVARAAGIAAGESQTAATLEEGSAEPARKLAQASRQMRVRLPALAAQLYQGGSAQASVSELQAAWTRTAETTLAPSPKGRKVAPAEGYTRVIVKLDESVDDPAQVSGALAAAYGAQVREVYRRAVKGFAVDVADASLASFIDALQADPRVDSVEEDQWVAADALTQSSATWGLDRVDQRLLPLTGSYTYAANGAGVHAYIVDSGLRSSHVEFTGRVKAGFDAVRDGRGTNDCHGHGTHVAGTVGGTQWGVAKGVTIVPVRVLGCDNRGTISGIIAGIDWMVQNAIRPAVANMSISAAKSTSLDAAVERAIASGITVAIAAGNDGANACGVSPARAPGAITVGATNSSDSRPSWSNYGTCLDVFAPGQDVTSAYKNSDTSTYTMWGTSMATPHVAGMAALLLQQNPAMTPAQVSSSIKASATSGVLKSVGSGSPNVMLFAGVSSPDPVVTPAPAPSTTTISVASMASSASVSGSRYWTAKVTVAVKNSAGALVPGALVKGGFTVGGSSESCTTASNGTCTLTTSRISLSRSSTTFTLGSLARSGAVYSASGNSAGKVTIGQP